ncbi:Uncharacterised protein [Edwardsiella hoshinae]|uniref:Uncharacterized protein n=1 Tax=Edwardsiella hoshinae TaxID=93378 RepID=A0A376D5J4_9GAMM|nr:hypothetical protein [Edwardsiella hoshinae]STC82796.1 Uncharacterised protein [Edwardsiella hoshinae]
MITVTEMQALYLRLDEIERRIAVLETLQQKTGLPEGYNHISVLAGAYGLSTGKAEELAKVTGVATARHSGQLIAHEASFNEAAEIVTSRAKRKIGSKYWYHPLIGKFTMSARAKK